MFQSVNRNPASRNTQELSREVHLHSSKIQFQTIESTNEKVLEPLSIESNNLDEHIPIQNVHRLTSQ